MTTGTLSVSCGARRGVAKKLRTREATMTALTLRPSQLARFTPGTLSGATEQWLAPRLHFKKTVKPTGLRAVKASTDAEIRAWDDFVCEHHDGRHFQFSWWLQRHAKPFIKT